MLGDAWQAWCRFLALCLRDVIFSSALTSTAPLLILSQAQSLLGPWAQRIQKHNWYIYPLCQGRRWSPYPSSPLAPLLNKLLMWHLVISVCGQRLSHKFKCTDVTVCIFTGPFLNGAKICRSKIFWRWVTNNANVKALFVNIINSRTLYKVHVRHRHLRVFFPLIFL